LTSTNGDGGGDEGFGARRRLVRGLLEELRTITPSASSADVAQTLTKFPPVLDDDQIATDYIYSHDDAPFLSIVLVALDVSPRMLNDALVGLDAQGDTDFEVIVVSDGAIDTSSISASLRRFSAGLNSRTRLVETTGVAGGVEGAISRPDAARAGASIARGRYLSIVGAADVVFGHYVATFSRLARRRPAGVLRARAITQPLRRVSWRDGEVGFEPASGASPASSSHFSVHEHLLAPATPPGSYALRREYLADLANGLDEDDALVEAAILAGVLEAPDDVIVLLRSFSP
jgi:hypothetical protein